MNRGKQFRVHALVTGNGIIRKILTVVRTPQHFVFIYPVQGKDCHVTYHMDGRLVERLGGQRGPIIHEEKYSALDDFKGDAPHLGAFLNIDKPSTWGSELSKTKADKEVVIDLTPCIGKTNVVSIHALLLVPGDLEPVNFYRRCFNILKCEIFKETIPWFAIIGYYKT